jgi:uncharacterized protein YdiU (UPF0061 family)
MPSVVTVDPLETLVFDNRFVSTLPADPERHNHRREVRNACYSLAWPTPVAEPHVLSYSAEAAALLDRTEEQCRTPSFAEVLAGNRLLPGMQPFAMRYGGHQFGSWAGQLGDGRAINLGEIVNRRGRRWTLQLKGAGPTPYSRRADGRAVLRSSLREFVCSEAMYHLGIPTTRALSLVTTGEQVLRDMFYDGHPRHEPGAVICRLAPSFLRFGNFEIHTATGEIELLRQLVDYSLVTDFAELSATPRRDGYLAWFTEICRRTAELVVHWMRVGFVHGVLNTDNMSILGLTIDYGPYGWLEDYDPSWTPNTTDAQGRRYCYGNQPQIVLWNLVQLANAIYPLIEESEPLQAALDVYRKTFQHRWRQALADKLGLTGREEGGDGLMQRILELLAERHLDMTIFFRRLADLPADHSVPIDFPGFFADAYYQDATGEADQAPLNDWLAAYRSRLGTVTGEERQRRRTMMNRVNPKYVFRNYLAQLAIDQAEQGDASLVEELLEVLRRPYDEQPGKEKFAQRRPEWARNRAGCSMLSCSS